MTEIFFREQVKYSECLVSTVVQHKDSNSISAEYAPMRFQLFTWWNVLTRLITKRRMYVNC